MYLWLNCEGWVRFGPYEWLRFDDDPQAIRAQDGTLVATFDGSCWRTAVEEYADYHWHTPMVTMTARHPHPMRGSEVNIMNVDQTSGEPESFVRLTEIAAKAKQAAAEEGTVPDQMWEDCATVIDELESLEKIPTAAFLILVDLLDLFLNSDASGRGLEEQILKTLNHRAPAAENGLAPAFLRVVKNNDGILAELEIYDETVRILGRIAGKDEEEVIDFLLDDMMISEETREAAMDALESLGGERVATMLIDRLSTIDYDVDFAQFPIDDEAAEVLQSIGAPAIPHLVEALCSADTSSLQKAVAAKVLQNAPEHAALTIPALLQVLNTAENNLSTLSSASPTDHFVSPNLIPAATAAAEALPLIATTNDVLDALIDALAQTMYWRCKQDYEISVIERRNKAHPESYESVVGYKSAVEVINPFLDSLLLAIAHFGTQAHAVVPLFLLALPLSSEAGALAQVAPALKDFLPVLQEIITGSGNSDDKAEQKTLAAQVAWPYLIDGLCNPRVWNDSRRHRIAQLTTVLLLKFAKAQPLARNAMQTAQEIQSNLLAIGDYSFEHEPFGEAVAKALGYIGGPGVIARLVAYINDSQDDGSSPFLRGAVKALGYIGPDAAPEAFKVVQGLLGSELLDDAEVYRALKAMDADHAPDQKE